MSEPKRATWAEFVEWMRRKRSDKDGELKRVASEVQTRGEAALVCWFVLGLGRISTGHLVDEWFAWLRAKGIYPPVDPPSVAEVLESVAGELDGRIVEIDGDVDAARAQAREVTDRVEGATLLDHIDDLRSQAAGIRFAWRRLRAKAKEFT
jgi:hypothetical protein